MHDSHEPLAFLACPVTPALLDGARRHLVMLRSLHEEVRLSVPSLCPPGTGAWRSNAADRYLDRLGDLRSELVGGLLRLREAEAALDGRIRELQEQLDATADAGVAANAATVPNAATAATAASRSPSR